MIKQFFLIWCFLSFVTSNELICNFIQHIDGYNCEISNSFKDKVTSIKGKHLSNKNNSDIEVLFAPLRSNLSNFPSEACLQFENLLKFDINGPYVTELSRPIFYGCKKVQQVNIMYTKIQEFEENLFYDLVTLEILTIGENSLEHLQRDLLKYNKNLKTLDLSYNKITSISTIIPSSVNIVKVFNNPCADRTFHPRDFAKIHELCPDENKRLSLNLTDAMKKFQELHLLIMKTSAKLDDFGDISESALNELDGRLVIAENHQKSYANRTRDDEREWIEKFKSIEVLKRDLKNLSLKVDKQNEEMSSFKEQQTANYERVIDQMSKVQQHLNNFSNDRIKFDKLIERNALESSFDADRKFIYIGFAINALMFAMFILLAFIKFNRPNKRDAFLLNQFDS